MKVIVLFLIITGAHAGYCQSENEIHFENISDSLEKYQDSDIFSTTESTDSIIFDYIQLDYKAFKKKYSLSDEEMVQTASAAEVTYQLARADLNLNQKIEETETLFKDTVPDSLEMIHKFNPHDYYDSLNISVDSLKIEIRSYEYDTIR